MAAPVAAFLDAKGAIRAWLNADTALTGAGHPVPLGFHLKRLRSPYRGAYGWLQIISGDDRYMAEGGSRARLSCYMYGITSEDADRAAVAYANKLRALGAGNVSVTGGICLSVGDITGPLENNDVDEWRRIIDADFYLWPSS